MPSLCTDRFEKELLARGFRLIAGVDEVGRGALAGPVMAAAVILDLRHYPEGLDDSKRLTKKQRERLASEIHKSAAAVALGQAGNEVIDRINILRATREAMRLAIGSLVPRPDALLIDAIKLDEVSLPQVPIIKGDALSVSIAAASIVAKVARDELMTMFDEKYPGYGFVRNAGYGTLDHRLAIERLGPSPIHRRTFRGVRSEDETLEPGSRQLRFVYRGGSQER